MSFFVYSRWNWINRIYEKNEKKMNKIDQHDFQLMFVVLLTIGSERSIQVDRDDNSQEDMTGKRGRMSQDE